LIRSEKKIFEIVFDIEKNISKTNYKGHDPYDGLNSKLFQFLPIINKNKFFKIAWTQFFKLSKFNFRSLFLINKGVNPKGMGLILSSYVNLFKLTKDEDWLLKGTKIANWLDLNSSKYSSHKCWGYNFDWQSRAFYVPKGTPSVVNTSFICHAFMDLYEIDKDLRWLEIVSSSISFILNDLQRYESNDEACFSYTPIDDLKIDNANLLGASVLARYMKIDSSDKFEEILFKTVNFSINNQNEDGSWCYAKTSYQKWIDSFHTAFNLFSLQHVNSYRNSEKVFDAINKGEAFYYNNFFTSEGLVKYYHNSLYPQDIHCYASILMYSKYSRKENNYEKNISWALDNMYLGSGKFKFRKNKITTLLDNNISYLRWCNSWMFIGLTNYLVSKK